MKRQLVISVLKRVFFLLLSLFCRVGGVADPRTVPGFTAAVALRQVKIPIQMGRMQRSSQCCIWFTHTYILYGSTSSFLWEDTDTPWMGPCGDLHCGREVPSVTTVMLVCLKGQCWSLSYAIHSLFLIDCHIYMFRTWNWLTWNAEMDTFFQ